MLFTSNRSYSTVFYRAEFTIPNSILVTEIKKANYFIARMNFSRITTKINFESLKSLKWYDLKMTFIARKI